MKYQWKEGGPTPKIEADIFGGELEKIEKQKGTIKALDVVEAARSPRSPIHKLFEWNDGKAAEEYRKDQARNLIGALTIVRVKVQSNGPVSDKAFHLVRPQGETKQGYVGRQRVMGDADLRKQVIEGARRELESFIRKFQHTAAMGKYVASLQEIVDQMRDEADQIVVDATKRHGKAA